VRLLLDTHVAVWSVSSSSRLPKQIFDTIADPDNDVFVSVVSLWEIAIKNRSGSKDPMPFSAAVGAFRFTEFGYTSLGLLPTHTFRFEGIPSLHGDPFDRLLLAQAVVERLTLVTHDAALARYGETVLTF